MGFHINHRLYYRDRCYVGGLMFHVPNKFRLKEGIMGTTDENGNNGSFRIEVPPHHQRLMVIASDGWGWEHVSVSRSDRCPTWEEMCYIKNLFWDDTDCVVQYHPPREDYINNHPFCLHLWRPVELELPRPDSIMVGVDNSYIKNGNVKKVFGV